MTVMFVTSACETKGRGGYCLSVEREMGLGTGRLFWDLHLRWFKGGRGTTVAFHASGCPRQRVRPDNQQHEDDEGAHASPRPFDRHLAERERS
jgi:hypothetical protein